MAADNQTTPLPELETACPDCNGSGGFIDMHPKDRIMCTECGGSGFVPTAAGRQVVKLMQHNFAPMAKRLRVELAV
jgi:DnaJ-class molecular chaperone